MKNLVAFSGLLAGSFAATLTAGAADVSTYDGLAEGFYGQVFSHNGVTYSEVNDVGGSFPGGDTFTPEDIGNNFIIENSQFLFDDFPQWGSAPNTLTFGTAYVPGPNLSLGAFARATMTLDVPASAAEVSMVFYENGPWGGIVFHLDAVRNGEVVDTATYTLADGGGRDNIGFATLAVSFDVGFDTLKMYATWGDGYSAPRLMIDNLTLTTIDRCPADFNGDNFLDFFDYLDYVTCFETGSCPSGRSADFNGDDFVDFFDYNDFVTAFETGC
jgi:hypothetical protein